MLEAVPPETNFARLAAPCVRFFAGSILLVRGAPGTPPRGAHARPLGSGSDEQMFGDKRQVPDRLRSDQVA